MSFELDFKTEVLLVIAAPASEKIYPSSVLGIFLHANPDPDRVILVYIQVLQLDI